MSVKTQTYSELAEKASKELTHSVNDWCMFGVHILCPKI